MSLRKYSRRPHINSVYVLHYHPRLRVMLEDIRSHSDHHSWQDRVQYPSHVHQLPGEDVLPTSSRLIPQINHFWSSVAINEIKLWYKVELNESVYDVSVTFSNIQRNWKLFACVLWLIPTIGWYWLVVCSILDQTLLSVYVLYFIILHLHEYTCFCDRFSI